MAVKDIYTRGTIIPTSENIGTSRDSEAIKKIQQSRGQQEQYKFYERKAIPIKEKNITSIKEKIIQKEQQIEYSRKKIEGYKKEELDNNKDYSENIDRLSNEISTYNKSLGILKTELNKYENITNPIDIVSYGENYSKEVLNYINETESYETDKYSLKRKNLEQIKREKDRIIKEGGSIKNGIAYNKQGDVIGFTNSQGKNNYENIMKKESISSKSPIIVKGMGLFIDGKFYSSSDQNWMENKIKEINKQKENVIDNKLNIPNDKIDISKLNIPINTTNLGVTNKTITIGMPKVVNESGKTEVTPVTLTTISKPGITDITLTGTRNLTKEEIVKKTEFEKLIKDKSFSQVFSLQNFDIKDFKWKGKRYDTNTAVEAMIYLTQQDLEEKSKYFLAPKLKTYDNIYNEEVKNITSSYSIGNITKEEADKKLEEVYSKYEQSYNKTVNEFEEGTAKRFLDSRQQYIDMFTESSAYKDALNPKVIVPTLVVGVATGAGAAGALGAGVKTVLTSTAVKLIAGGALGLSVAKTGQELYNLHAQGRLNPTTARTIIGPQIISLGVASIGGIIGGGIGVLRYKKIEAEFQLNIKSQLLTDKKMQNILFTDSNIKRGYGIVKYRGYDMAVVVNKNIVNKIKLYNSIKSEGTITSQDVTGIDINKRLIINEKLKAYLKNTKEDIYLYEEGGAVIKQNTFTKVTGQKVQNKILYSTNGRINNKYVEFVFNLKKNGRITDLYIIVKTPTEIDGLIIAKIGKVILSQRINKIPISGSLYPLELTSLNIKPIGWKLISGKTAKLSIFQQGNIIYEKSIADVMIKDLKGVNLGKEVIFGDFVDIENTLFIRRKNIGETSSGKIAVSSLKQIENGNKFDTITEILAFKSKTTTDSFPSFTFTKTKPSPITPFSDTFGFSDIGKTSSVVVKPKPSPILNTDYILGKTALVTPTNKVISPKINIKPELDIFNSDNIFTSAKISNIRQPISNKQDLMSLNTNEFQELSLGLNKKERSKIKEEVKPKIKELEKVNFGFNTLQKVNSLSKPQIKTAQTSLLSQNSKELLSFSNLQKNIQTQRVINPQQTQTIQKNKTIQRLPPQKPFNFNFGFKFGEEKNKKPKLKEKDILDWGFVAEVRRKGKFKPVSKVVSKKEAFLIGEDIVKNTLGASFRVKKTEKKIKVKNIPSKTLGWLGNSEFYTKQEKGEDIFIQKREKRLSTKGERKEIQKAKKAKQNFPF